MFSKYNGLLFSFFILSLAGCPSVSTTNPDEDGGTVNNVTDDPPNIFTPEDGGIGEGESDFNCKLSCNDVCVDSEVNRNNCGDCGVHASPSQLCFDSKILEATFKTTCSSKEIVIVTDNYSSDDEATNQVANSLNSICDKEFGVSLISEADRSKIDQDTGMIQGHPNSAILLSGGPYVNFVASHAQNFPGSLQITSDDGFIANYIDTQDNQVLLSINMEQDVSAIHDFLIIQVLVNPLDNQIIIMGYGITGPGTAAAWQFVAQQNLPSSTWMLLEWNSGAAEEFKLLASK